MEFGTVTLIDNQHGMLVAGDGTRYFFYTNRVIGSQPVRGSRVIFRVSAKQPKPGKLPYATDVVVLMSERESLQKLAGFEHALKNASADEVSS